MLITFTQSCFPRLKISIHLGLRLGHGMPRAQRKCFSLGNLGANNRLLHTACLLSFCFLLFFCDKSMHTYLRILPFEHNGICLGLCVCILNFKTSSILELGEWDCNWIMQITSKCNIFWTVVILILEVIALRGRITRPYGSASLKELVGPIRRGYCMFSYLPKGCQASSGSPWIII